MKLLLIFIISLIINTTLSATFLFDKYNRCIEDYWIKGTKLHYVRSDNNREYTTSSKNYVRYILPGYEYDTDNDICRPLPAYFLGLTLEMYNFLMALSALLFFSMTSGVVAYMVVKKS